MRKHVSGFILLDSCAKLSRTDGQGRIPLLPPELSSKEQRGARYVFQKEEKEESYLTSLTTGTNICSGAQT
jgi:hypothetical protein